MRIISMASAALALLATTDLAAASGGLDCFADNAEVRFDAIAGVSHGAGDVFFSFEATVEILVDSAPDDLRSIHLDRSGLTHHWLDGDEAKMRLHYERPGSDFGTVDLVIEAGVENMDEGAYAGTYLLTILGVAEMAGPGEEFWSSEGRAACTAE